MRSLVLQDMLRGDLDADARVSGHELPYLIEALAGEVGHWLLALAALKVSVVEPHHV